MYNKLKKQIVKSDAILALKLYKMKRHKKVNIRQSAFPFGARTDSEETKLSVKYGIAVSRL
jgi:hypothetical protein